MDNLLNKPILDIITLIITIVISIIFLIFIIFLLIKLFKININFKNFSLLTNNSKNKLNHTQTLIQNFLIKLSLIWKNSLNDINRISQEKYYLLHILERKRQMSHVERTFNVIFAKIRTEFYSMKRDYRINQLGWNKEDAKKDLADSEVYHFEAVLESLQYEVKDYFRTIFEQNGLELLKTESEGTKNSEFEDYIKSHQYNIIDMIVKYINIRCFLIKEPDMSIVYDYFKNKFFHELEKAIEDCISSARLIHLEIIDKIKDQDSLMEEILNTNIKYTLDNEIDELLYKKEEKEKK